MITKRAVAPASLLAVLTVVPLGAQPQDEQGSKDHPLISRYPGSVIREYGQKEFDEYQLVLGPLKSGSFQKTQKLEGKITRIRYNNPPGRSSLEIFRNYGSALQQAGFQTLFVCEQQECGESKNDEVLGWFGYLGQEYSRYLASKLTRPDAHVWRSTPLSRQESPTALPLSTLKPESEPPTLKEIAKL